MTGEVTGGAIGAAVRAGPASVADFYKDKQFRIIGGGPPGGGVERDGRVPGRHIFRLIPFRPPFPRSDASPG